MTLVLWIGLCASAAMGLGACVVGDEEGDEAEDVVDVVDEMGDVDQDTVPIAATTSTVVKRPVRDVLKTSVLGVTDTTSLYKNVDDSTSFATSDNATTYVRSATGVATAYHTTGYTLGVPGTVTKIVANYRAEKGTASGTIKLDLYNGSTLVKSGPLRTLGAWTNYTETFTSLSIPANADLRLRVVLSNTPRTGYVRYTQIWMSATVTCSTCVSFASQVQPIFTARCIGCHGGTAPNLTVGNSYAQIVNVTSSFCPATKRVVPGQSASSYLIASITPGGTAAGCAGGRMSGYLTAAEATIIRDWVTQGAKNN